MPTTISKFTLAGLICLIAGIFTFEIFRALPGIGLGLLLFAGLTQIKHYKELYTKKYFLIPSLIYPMYLANLLLIRTDTPHTLEAQLIFYLPYFILPFAMALLPAITRRQLHSLYGFFVLLCALCAFGTLINFALHFDAIVASYVHSKVMPTPINHVRFSLLIAFAFFICLYLYKEKFVFRYAWERPLLIGCAIFLFIYAHVLSVRSGLLTLYAGIFLSALWLSIRYKRYKLLIVISAVLILIPTLSYFFIPTFGNKVRNTLEDLKRINVKGSGAHYSMAGRVVSYQVAWEIIKEYPWTGSGAANLRDEVDKTYERHFPEIIDNGVGTLTPHNQFIYLLSATGIIGLIVFLICFYYPLFAKASGQFPLLRVHYLILTVSFLFEATMETQTGNIFALTFIFLPLLYLKDHD